MTVTLIAPAVVDAPTRTDTRIGLYASSLRLPPTDAEGNPTRWQAGISYRPVNGNIPSASGSTFYPCGAGFDIDTESTGVVTWEPWGIALGDDCNPGSTDEAEEIVRAERRLQSQTEYLLSRTFWTGDVGTGTFASLSSPNRALADTDSDELTTTGPVGVVTAFSRAIQYLADTIGSQRGMIHVAPALAPFLSFYGVVIREGSVLVTALADHIVVLGYGYDGSAPDGSAAGAGTSWIYATSIVRSEVSPISTYPYVNRETNNLETRATRLVIAEWDLQAHAALQVCIPDPGPSCIEVPS